MGRFDGDDDEFVGQLAMGGRALAQAHAEHIAADAARRRARRERDRAGGVLLWVECMAATDRGVQIGAFFSPATQRIAWVPRSCVEAVRGQGDTVDEAGFFTDVEPSSEVIDVGYKGLVRLAKWKAKDCGWLEFHPRMPREDDL